MEQQPEKLFYSIGEVASILGERPSLVRFWTDSFPQLVKPRRTAQKNNRIYSPADVRTLRTLHFLIKQKRMTLKGAARKMETDRHTADRDTELLGRLQAIRAQLREVSEALK